MSALMSDVLEGNVTPGVCNAAVNAGGKLLKVVEMSQRYGVAGSDTERHLSLAGATDTAEDGKAKKTRIRELEGELQRLRAEVA